MKHLVIFDIDGTLGDTNALDHDCYKTAFKKVSGVSELPLNLWEGCPHITDTGVTQHLYQKLFNRFADDSELSQIKMQLVNELIAESNKRPAGAYTIPGASEMLTHLINSKDYAVAVATGCWKSNADIKFEILGIQPGTIPMAHADDFLSRRQITLDAIAKSILHYDTALFSRITYVGDGLWDLKTATRLGLHFVGIDCNGDNKLRSAGAQSVIKDYTNADMFFGLLAS